MELLLPKFGLFFWTLVIFLIFFFILRRMAWKPIIEGLRKREEGIANSLAEAEKAREEMGRLTSENEALLAEARSEREKILRDANEVRDKIVSDAKKAAQDAQAKEIEKARQQIQTEKNQALQEIKASSASIALEVAEKILRQQLDDKKSQEALAKKLVEEIGSNVSQN
ncbi:MAG: F0F1 ATP synthase subunit B [Bacteroidota bacterium]